MDGHVEMFNHFFDSLRTGMPSESEGIVGWNMLAAVEAATLSAQSGRRERVKSRR